MIASAPAWAVWLALGLWGVALVVGAAVFVQARRLWRHAKPTVLAMMGAASALGIVDSLLEADDDEPSTENAWRHERGA